jgi:hypothetical protein
MIVAGYPGPVGVRHHTVLVVEHVLAQVPYRSVIGLGVPVQRHLQDAPVRERGVLRDQRLDLLAVPLNGLGFREQGHLGSKRQAVNTPQHQDRLRCGGGVQRVGDVGGIGECRRGEIHPFALRSDREALGALLVHDAF